MHETIEALSAYVDDEVSPAERARIDAHLATCIDCASRKRLLERASASLRTLPAPAPTLEESRRIREGVLGRTRRRSLRAGMRGRLRPVWAGAGAGALALVVAGVVAGTGVLRNHTAPETTGGRAGSALSAPDGPAFGNPGDVRSFVFNDAGVKQAVEALRAFPAPTARGAAAPKPAPQAPAPQAPDARQQYGTNRLQGATTPLGASTRSAAPPSAPEPPRAPGETGDSTGTAVQAGSPERSAADCLAEQQHDQPNASPLLARAATYTGKPAWLLVYVIPAPSPGAHEQLAVYLVGRANCGVLTYQIVGAP